MKGTEMTMPLSDGDIEALFMTYLKEDNLASAIVFARAIEAACAHKPAKQVAGVVIDLNALSINSIHDTYVGVFGPLPEELMMNDILFHVEELIRAANPALEPVSVPVKWEDRHAADPSVNIHDHKLAEIAEWRDLAAERGWVK